MQVIMRLKEIVDCNWIKCRTLYKSIIQQLDFQIMMENF